MSSKKIIISESQAKSLLEFEKKSKNWYYVDLFMNFFEISEDIEKTYDTFVTYKYTNVAEDIEYFGFMESLYKNSSQSGFFMNDDHKKAVEDCEESDLPSKEKRKACTKIFFSYIDDLDLYIHKYYPLVAMFEDDFDLKYKTGFKIIHELYEHFYKATRNFGWGYFLSIFELLKRHNRTDLSAKDFMAMTFRKDNNQVYSIIQKIMGVPWNLKTFRENMENLGKEEKMALLKQYSEKYKLPIGFVHELDWESSFL